MDILTDLHHHASSYLAANQFASGGLFIGVTGGLIALARRLPGRFAAWVWRQITVEIEIRSEDNLFAAVEFLLARERPLGRKRVYRAKYRPSAPSLHWEDGPEVHRPRGEGGSVELSLGNGSHWLWRSGRLFLVRRESKEPGGAVPGFTKTAESFLINVFSRDVGHARRFLAEAVNLCHPPERKVVRIYTARGNDWRMCVSSPARPPESLVLRDGLFEELANDVRQFFARADWYRNLGIPYRRGYLFTGAPGNGKTTTMLVLAGMFDAPLCILDVGASGMTNQGLRELMASAPPGAFLVLEDIDAMFQARSRRPASKAPVLVAADSLGGEPAAESDSDGVTLSGLLNALDGVATPDGRLVFMSTNHPELLDPALIRPGRVDKRVEFRNADELQARRMFLKFFGGGFDMDLLAGGFAARVGDGSHSMAEVQGILLESGDDPARALELAGSPSPQNRAA